MDTPESNGLAGPATEGELSGPGSVDGDKVPRNTEEVGETLPPGPPSAPWPVVREEGGVAHGVIRAKKPRGFAAMSKAERSAIASKGGKRSQELGVAHRFDAAEASKAGKKGGISVSKDRAHMSAIAKLGGAARRAR